MKHRIQKRKARAGMSRIVTTADGGVVLGRTGSHVARRAGQSTAIQRELQLRRRVRGW